MINAQPSNYDRVGSGRINTPRPLLQQQSIGLQHSSRLPAGLLGGPSLQMSPFGGGSPSAAAATGDTAATEEQSAFDMAQSAAARVTGSAAAALAAARFKMLRSNTLAAAFGQRSAAAADDQGGVATAPVNLLATRMKDERIISSTTSMTPSQARPSFASGGGASNRPAG